MCEIFRRSMMNRIVQINSNYLSAIISLIAVESGISDFVSSDEESSFRRGYLKKINTKNCHDTIKSSHIEIRNPTLNYSIIVKSLEKRRMSL